MNNDRVKEIAESILQIEHESIRKRRDTINSLNRFKGTNKADIDVVNSIIAVLDGGGNNENKSN